MRALVIVLFLIQPLAAKELVKNGGVKSPQGWTNTGGSPTTTFRLDRKVGKAKKGSLYLANTNADEKIPHNWRTRVETPAGKPYRLKLSVQIRTKGMAPGAKANVMVQLWPKQGNAVGYAWCGQVTGDTEWKQIHAVFEVPEACETVAVLAYLVGKGEVWFDDFSIQKTKDDLTGPPAAGGGDDKYWKRARDAAKEIPWLFDAEEAKARAKKERKPILLYVRSTDDRNGLFSAISTLRADKVPNRDDGYRKDILFRAGPLSDEDVAELISRRFVPHLVTYHFGSHHVGRGRVGWLPDARGGKTEFDPKGHLVASHDGKNALECGWLQMLRMRANGKARRVQLKARVKTRGMAKDSEVNIHLDCWGGPKPETLTTESIRGNQGWNEINTTVELPREFTQVRLWLYLKGKGEAWFDDISVIDRGAEQVFNGDINPKLGVDPLEAYGLSGKQAITPALVVVHNGEVRKLHRIGTMSTDLVDHFLRGALNEVGAKSRARSPADLLADGELQALVKRTANARGAERVLRARALTRLGELPAALEALAGLNSVDAARARATVYMRKGEWDKARAEFSGASGSRAAQFWQAWCDRRLGRHTEARQAWKKLADTDDRWGRRAAASVLATGPLLWLSHSEREWPRSRALPEESEGAGLGGFDAAQSVRLLLEFQNANGSFGSHAGTEGFGYWDGTITAYAAEAVWRWLDHLPADLKRRAAVAHDRAVGFLRKWSKRPYDRLDAFNAAYVLSYFVRLGEREAGERLMPRIAKGQQKDGNWTVYSVTRPASFNTALSVIALAEAKAAGWEVPEAVLEKGAKALAAMRQDTGRFPYSTGPGHEWMSTEHGSIARDSLCERALLQAGIGDRSKVDPALERYLKFGHELRLPTKAYYDYFNSRGHGGYYFFFAHRNALEVTEYASAAVRKRVRQYVREQVLRAREGDGTFMDHSMNGRGYGTAQALILLAPREKK